jgi:hypothetical protein
VSLEIGPRLDVDAQHLGRARSFLCASEWLRTGRVRMVMDRQRIGLTDRAAVLGNVVLLGAACWESVAQYPYPEGNSVIPFVALAVCTPILSLMALLRGGRRAMREDGGA